RGDIEEARVVASRVVGVGAQQWQLLKEEHAGFIGLPVKLDGQDIGQQAKGVDVGILGDAKVGIETLRCQLVEAIRRRIARASQERRPAVDGKVPAAWTDVPLDLSEPEGILDARRLRTA